MGSKIFVTGATGLVGGNLVRELSARGEQVRILVRRNSNTMAVDGLSGVEKVLGDITDRDSLREAMKGCECVYHCAADVRMWIVPMDVMRRINVEGTRNVLETAREMGVRRVVHVSTVDAIGFSTPDGWGKRDKPSNEDVPFQNERFAIPYMITKYEAQQVALTMNKLGLEVVIVNPTYMLGPWDVKPSSGAMIIEVAKGLAKGYTTGGNNFVHIKDVVSAMITAMEKGRPGELYILGNENLSYKEIFTKVAKVVGVPPPKFKIPKIISLTAGFFGTLYGELTHTEPNINHLTAAMGYVEHYFDSSKAVRELNMPQTPIEVAIEDAYRWFLDHGYIKKGR